MLQQTGSESLGAGGWASLGLGAANMISNIALGGVQAGIANKQLKAQEDQRRIENERYNAQMKMHKEATDAAVSSASSLKSAGAKMAKAAPAKPQTNQAQANPNPNAQQAQAKPQTNQAQANPNPNAQQAQAKPNPQAEAAQAPQKEMPMERK